MPLEAAGAPGVLGAEGCEAGRADASEGGNFVRKMNGRSKVAYRGGSSKL